MTETPSVVVCFPGGSGGNFVGFLCHHLRTGDSVTLWDDGSAHGSPVLQVLQNFTLDSSVESFVGEILEIRKLKNQNWLYTGHIRNVNEVVKNNHKAVYISFDKQDIPVLSSRLKRKHHPKLGREDYYRIAGPDWPSWEDYHTNKAEVIDELDHLVYDFYDEWYWVLPSTSDQVFELKFNDFVNNYNWIIPLAKFIGVEDFDYYKAVKAVDQYRQAQLDSKFLSTEK